MVPYIFSLGRYSANLEHQACNARETCRKGYSVITLVMVLLIVIINLRIK